MSPTPPRRRPPPPIDEIWRIVQELVDEKTERDLNARKTRDEQHYEYQAMVESAVAQIAGPRFGRVDQVNDEQLRYLKEMERERMRRHAAEARLADQERREEVARAAKAADRRHALKVWAAVTLILGPFIALLVAAIASHFNLAVPAPAAAETSHH